MVGALVARLVAVPGARVVRGAELGVRGNGGIWSPIDSCHVSGNCGRFPCRRPGEGFARVVGFWDRRHWDRVSKGTWNPFGSFHF